jgi:hypothetical protein
MRPKAIVSGFFLAIALTASATEAALARGTSRGAAHPSTPHAHQSSVGQFFFGLRQAQVGEYVTAARGYWDRFALLLSCHASNSFFAR